MNTAVFPDYWPWRLNRTETGHDALMCQHVEAMMSLRSKITKLLPDEVALADAYVDNLLKSRPVKTGDNK